MRVSDFDFELPDEQIARFPAENRTGSRLLKLDGTSGEIQHGMFTDVESLLEPGDLLVMNNTRVIPARLFGRKESGGKLEVLIERVTNEKAVLAHVRSRPFTQAGQQDLPGRR